MKTKHDMVEVAYRDEYGMPQVRYVTPRAYRFAKQAPFPLDVAKGAGWWEETLREDEKRAAKNRRRAVPRGRAYDEDVRRRAEELARACLAELLTVRGVYVTTPEELNRYIDLSKDVLVPEDGDQVWYGKTSII